jgi:hypothetical protein
MQQNGWLAPLWLEPHKEPFCQIRGLVLVRHDRKKQAGCYVRLSALHLPENKACYEIRLVVILHVVFLVTFVP